MADLKTTYMGLKLANPIVVASSGITGSVDGVKRCADAGAGAVVLKSMFEELIIAKSENLDQDILKSEHPEAYDYVRAELGMQLGPKPYLKFITEVKKDVSIPVIASVNCVSAKWWTPYAKDIESAGANALELNISHFPRAERETSLDIEQRYTDIVHDVASRISIPVAVKIGFYFTSLWNVMEDIVNAGARALVLFNRYYGIDVNTTTKKFVPEMMFSCPEEASLPLRWIGLMSGRLKCDIAASTGIHTSEGIVKMLLAGATVVQVGSVLYTQGPKYLKTLIRDFDSWLAGEGYDSVGKICGFAHKSIENADILLKRLQYIQSLDDASKYEF